MKIKTEHGICGVDEAGRGALAGPVCAAAVIMPKRLALEGVTDSKMIPRNKREKLYEVITQHPRIYWSVFMVSAQLIEEVNVLQATMKAMHGALDGLGDHLTNAHEIVIDGNYFNSTVYNHARTMVKGDMLVPAISAASIIAKVTRDRWMREVAHPKYPEYQFDKHVGYGTEYHRQKIQELGMIEYHRPSFLKKLLVISQQVPMF